MMTTPTALAGILCDRKMLGDLPFHCAGEKYLAGLRDAGAVTGVALPVLPGPDPIGHLGPLLEVIDGLLLPGSPSNIEPWRYGGGAPEPGTPTDPDRDAHALPLIKHALKTGLPLFVICRGFQELNVALGGTLHAQLWDRPPPDAGEIIDHREDLSQTADIRYGPAHQVRVTPGGLLQRLTGESTLTVNSLHNQGVDRLSAHLIVEAVAPDGTVEAVRVDPQTPYYAGGFAFGVQWHPDWEPTQTPHYAALFSAFGDAVRAHRAARLAPSAASRAS